MTDADEENWGDKVDEEAAENLDSPGIMNLNQNEDHSSAATSLSASVTNSPLNEDHMESTSDEALQ